MAIQYWATAVLAENAPQGPEFGKSSPIGLAIVVILMVCTALLVFSMNKHMKKLPESFDPQHPEPDQAVDEGTDRGSSESATDPAS
ncbi:MAG: hypothetical protein ACRCSF_09985 [Mycobacteriaceae bacterium]